MVDGRWRTWGSRHPAHAIALALAMIAGAVASRSLVLLGAIGVVGVFAICAGGVPVRRVVVRLRATSVVVGAAVLLRVLTAPEHALHEGASLAARVFDAALWSTWLVTTRTAHEIELGLGSLGVPRGIVTLLAMTRRFGVQLGATMRSAWNATAARGGFRTARTTVRSLGAVAGLLLVRALDRTDRVRLALAFRGGESALSAGDRRFSWSSWLALVAVVGALALADRAWGAP